YRVVLVAQDVVVDDRLPVLVDDRVAVRPELRARHAADRVLTNAFVLLVGTLVRLVIPPGRCGITPRRRALLDLHGAEVVLRAVLALGLLLGALLPVRIVELEPVLPRLLVRLLPVLGHACGELGAILGD